MHKQLCPIVVSRSLRECLRDSNCVLLQKKTCLGVWALTCCHCFTNATSAQLSQWLVVSPLEMQNTRRRFRSVGPSWPTKPLEIHGSMNGIVSVCPCIPFNSTVLSLTWRLMIGFNKALTPQKGLLWHSNTLEYRTRVCRYDIIHHAC